METKRFINSKYYSLKEVKKLNDYLLSLQIVNIYTSTDFDYIIKLYQMYPPYEKLNDYVFGSEKYNNILKGEEEYKIAKTHLDSLNHKCVKIVDEVYPDYLEIYQHTIIVEKTDYRYNNYDERESYTFMDDVIFFTYKNKIINDFNDLILPYICKEYYEPKDLVDKIIEENDLLQSEIFAYKMSERLGVKLRELEKVFQINKLIHYNSMTTSFVNYEGKDYYDSQVKSLITLANEACAKKYIKEDKYIEYPSHVPYLEFLKLLDAGDYKNVKFFL